jgi:hypothetical protein
VAHPARWAFYIAKQQPGPTFAESLGEVDCVQEKGDRFISCVAARPATTASRHDRLVEDNVRASSRVACGQFFWCEWYWLFADAY